MNRHQLFHETYVEGCFGCKVSSIQPVGCYPTRSIGAGKGDATAEKLWQKDLSAYQDARAQGVQPAGTTMPKIRQAMELSDKAGKAYDATTNSFTNGV